MASKRKPAPPPPAPGEPTNNYDNSEVTYTPPPGKRLLIKTWLDDIMVRAPRGETEDIKPYAERLFEYARGEKVPVASAASLETQIHQKLNAPKSKASKG
jgi:hypothetical protein